MPKSRLSAVLSLLFVFVSGALAGAFVYRAYVVSRPAAAPGGQRRPTPAEWQAEYLNHRITLMHDRLKLGDQQTTELTSILNQEGERMRQLGAKRHAEDVASPVGVKRHAEDEAIGNELVGKINAILRPDQQVLYRQLRDELQRDRMRREQQGQRGPGGPEGPGGPGGPPPGPPPSNNK